MIPTLGILMSINDPQWGGRGGGNDNDPGNGGRRPNQGPPDLEEIWRDFNRRLNGMLGKNNGRGDRDGNQGGGGMPPVDLNPRAVGGGIGILAALVVLV